MPAAAPCCKLRPPLRESSVIRRLPIAFALLPLAGLLAGCPGGESTCDDRGLQEVEWFQDRDRDTYGNRTVVIIACEDRDPSGLPDSPESFVRDATDCDDLRPAVYPQAIELCDGLDNNCNGAIDDGLPFNDFWLDNDGDGFGDPALQVEACSTPDNGANRPGDCDDSNPNVNPDAFEICNGIDDDCDTFVDDDDDAPLLEGGVDTSTGQPWRPDIDSDGYGNWNASTELYACEQPDGYVADATDCDDTDAQINTTNQEICNGIDDDCDQLFDDSDPSLDAATQTVWYRDADADGHGVPDESILTCTTPWFYALVDDDCDDADPLVLSAADTTWALDADGDGFGAGTPSEPMCTAPSAGFVSLVAGTDCDDTNPDIFPDQIEVCDTVDNDCDELIDDDDLWFEEGGVSVDSMSAWFQDGDGDGFGNPNQGFLSCLPIGNEVSDFTDCLDGNPDINPAATEVCDGLDNDCDFRVDDNDDNLDVDSGTVFTRDADGDGWGNLQDVIRSCAVPDGYVAEFGDCDDNDAAIGLPTNWWPDVDLDGQGSGTVSTPASCTPPGPDYVPWYIDSVEDCAPDDDLAESGEEICYDGVDQGCDGRDYLLIADGACNLVLPDTCLQAQAMQPIIPGGQAIEGTLAGAVDNLDTANNPSCANNAQSAATERIMKVLVPANMRLRARHRVVSADSVVYLLSSCFSVASCEVGAGIAGSNQYETLIYDNVSSVDEIHYLVLDGRRRTSDSREFRVELFLEEIPAP
ncbi:MAG: putative metal-binding motif-containing protein [Alphaproteobacteria bacterium]|nr:putative metal-binding motif-containing protein [Alphaproteobacteria bacterium]MCB9692360.1 putative metal-binding motif-containing protein [Alphaproteobacteria bacterium]